MKEEILKIAELLNIDINSGLAGFDSVGIIGKVKKNKAALKKIRVELERRREENQKI